jgi:hypothetical protein
MAEVTTPPLAPASHAVDAVPHNRPPKRPLLAAMGVNHFGQRLPKPPVEANYISKYKCLRNFKTKHSGHGYPAGKQRGRSARHGQPVYSLWPWSPGQPWGFGPSEARNPAAASNGAQPGTIGLAKPHPPLDKAPGEPIRN